MDYGLALNVIISGIIIVFLALSLLILVLWAMGKIAISLSNKGSNAPEVKIPAAAPPRAVPAPAPAGPIQVEKGIEEEVVAVITAAVSAMLADEGISGPVAVKSIRRARESRPAWSVAGLQQNTRPF